MRHIRSRRRDGGYPSIASWETDESVDKILLDVRFEDGGLDVDLSMKDGPGGEEGNEKGEGDNRQPSKCKRRLSESGGGQGLGDDPTRSSSNLLSCFTRVVIPIL